MSQENVELVRRSLEHVNRTGEPLWEVLDPEIEWIIDPTGLLAGTYRGHEGVKESSSAFEKASTSSTSRSTI
jgi:ketosteroid isomerase-like protein